MKDIIDHGKRLSDKMMDLADYFARTLAKPDPRAWDHLLIYCPREALERRLAAVSPQEREPC